MHCAPVSKVSSEVFWEATPRLVANPAVNEEWSITAEQMKELKEKHTKIAQQKKEYNKDVELTAEILKKTDLISHLFGSPLGCQ
ncbi:hypothetical protein CYANOKiyG1_63560 [Okeania sp. KiyG1]|nr:hypothetical protein CYANOKiyG1_63560 [Okeania sp. KiyG1]